MARAPQKKDVDAELAETRHRLELVEQRLERLEGERAGTLADMLASLPPLPPNAGRDSMRRILERCRKVPKSAWRNVPRDASQHLDKYLYGGE
jgi:hypothetical protein